MDNKEEKVTIKGGNIISRKFRIFSTEITLEKARESWDGVGFYDLEINRVEDLNSEDVFEKFWETWLEENWDYEDERSELEKRRIKEIYFDKVEDYEYFEDSITLYRVMNVNLNDFLKQIREFENQKLREKHLPMDEFVKKKLITKSPSGVGIYWTWDDESALDFARTNLCVDSGLIRITAIVNNDEYARDIDWKSTILANLREGIGEVEKEIRLYDNVIIKIILIEVFSQKNNNGIQKTIENKCVIDKRYELKVESEIEVNVETLAYFKLLYENN